MNGVVREPSKTVVLYGDVSTQSSHELAFLIGDLLDLHRRVVVILEQDDILPSGIEAMGQGIAVRITSKLPSVRATEILWVVDSTQSFDLRRYKISIPVFVMPKTKQDIAACFDIVKSRPSWRFAVVSNAVAMVQPIKRSR